MEPIEEPLPPKEGLRTRSKRPELPEAEAEAEAEADPPKPCW